MKVDWHWVRDNDYPKNKQSVCCLLPINEYSKYYCRKTLMFSEDLYKLNPDNFEEYKGKKQCGFVDYDYLSGYYLLPDVICWCELPDLPDELKNERT